jgi:hypothetical protein
MGTDAEAGAAVKAGTKVATGGMVVGFVVICRRLQQCNWTCCCGGSRGRNCYRCIYVEVAVDLFRVSTLMALISRIFSNTNVSRASVSNLGTTSTNVMSLSWPLLVCKFRRSSLCPNSGS